MKIHISLKHISLLISLAMLAILVFVSLNQESNPVKINKEYSQGTKDDPNARRNFEFKKLRDINTNRIPENILNLEQVFAAGLPKAEDMDNVRSLSWTERGPNNVGGRTRALANDVSNNNIIIAGGVSGGMWRSTNFGQSWMKTTTSQQLHSATCLVQDIRSGQSSTWYAGTGEREGNSAGLFTGGNAFAGNGIFKSTDNGLSWNLLPSTSGIPPGSFSSNWQYVWNIVTNPSSPQSEVYAATVGAVYKSTNGGNNWDQVLGLGTFAKSTFTDVAITGSGVVYAAGSRVLGGTMNGVRRSTNGSDWVNITPPEFPPDYGRIVLAIAPSNQNIMYVAVQGVPSGTPNSVNKHQLWRYRYISGDGTGSGGEWLARGGNLPVAGQNNYGTFNEPFDSQDGYDLFLKVKPDDENFLLLNAVNMYRSTDGFATAGNAKRIGGYQPTLDSTQANGTYPNHHPDVHSGFFRTGSNVEFVSGHDGGISRTSDITANVTNNNPVTWLSLNNGYNVTQFYGISIAPESGSYGLTGGFQDNGSYGAVSGNLITPWTMINSGDGGYCDIAPIADNRVYSTSQNGDLDRINRDGSNNVTMKPAGSARQAFINPHALDPNNSSYLYYGAGTPANPNGIWRNSNIKNADTTLGWSYISGSAVSSQDAIVSAIGISKTPADIVYYGTDQGHIRKITNANSSNPVVSGDLNADLPAGYVSCIAPDPADGNKVMAVFSNYNISSIWYSTNGGANWTSVEGNLSGTNGPSVRWAEIFYVQNQLHYMVATSTGMYYTRNLNGESTVWIQEAVNAIGNVVCVMTKFREADKTLVVGTHGRGSFQTQILEPISVGLSSGEIPDKYVLRQNYPNPFNPSTNIEFSIPKNAFVNVRIYDLLGREIAQLVSENLQAGTHRTLWNAAKYPSGIYFCKINSGNYSQVIKMILAK